MIEWPSSKTNSSTCGLMLIRRIFGVALQAGHLDLVVEVTDVAQDRLVLHRLHVLEGDDALVAGGGDDDVRPADGLFDGLDLEAVHQRLQRVDRVDLGDRDAGALRLERLGAALADVAVATDQRGLAADQDVGAAVDAVDQRVAGAVLVVELALGDRVVDVDGRERQLTGGGELVQPQHAGGGLLGDALDRLGDLGPLGLVGLEALADQRQEHLVLVGGVVLGGRHDAGLLELRAAQHQHGGVTAVVEDHVGGLARPGQHLLGGPPVLLEALALPREDRDALGLLGGAVRADDGRGGGVVLGGEDVARRPADLGAEARPASRSARRSGSVMCSEPETRAPLSGSTSAYSRRSAIRPGISCSASRISLRPNSAKPRSATLKSMPLRTSAVSSVQSCRAPYFVRSLPVSAQMRAAATPCRHP